MRSIPVITIGCICDAVGRSRKTAAAGSRDGVGYLTFDAVSGTGHSQSANRNQGNSHAPLPDGLYTVSERITAGTVPGVGKTFIGIYPQFKTGRSDLGIHLNPNFNHPGYNGTWGCIGLTTSADRDAINEFVLRYHPQNLVFNITSMN